MKLQNFRNIRFKACFAEFSVIQGLSLLRLVIHPTYRQWQTTFI
ncbi:hypothetical protein [Leptothoe spongobia]|nr:hypothetical protein [Leptothoe spongobia]